MKKSKKNKEWTPQTFSESWAAEQEESLNRFQKHRERYNESAASEREYEKKGKTPFNPSKDKAYKPISKKDIKLRCCPFSKVVYSPTTWGKKRIVVPCGKCAFCLKRKQREIILRARCQMLTSMSAFFVTLTYAPGRESYSENDGSQVLVYSDIQNFLKRLRKQHPSLQFKYMVCGEYGSKRGRPHYHMILFCLNHVLPTYLVSKYVASAWSIDGEQLGIIDVSKCNERTITYVSKYITKTKEQKDIHEVSEFLKWSKGFGEQWCFNNRDVCRGRSFIVYPVMDKNGKQKTYYTNVPLYYKKKVFDQYERDMQLKDYLASDYLKDMLKIFGSRHARDLFMRNVELYSVYEDRHLNKIRENIKQEVF